jgi:2-keto-3-deoxy-L-rhamnonate aldolase RhmA
MDVPEMRRRMLAGECMIGFSVRLARSTEIASVARACGYDWLMVDMEHAAIDVDLATRICLAANEAGLVSIVRPPGHDPTICSRLLDGGAGGLLVPHVDRPEDIRPILDHCKFAPVGRRSYGGPLAQLDYASLPHRQHMEAANVRSMIIAMVESPTSVANAEAIAALEGVDMLSFGTHDLTLEMGIPGELADPRVEEAYRAVIAACRKHGKSAGVGGIADRALLERYLPLGFTSIGIASDLGLVLAGGRAQRAMLRQIVGR